MLSLKESHRIGRLIVYIFTVAIYTSSIETVCRGKVVTTPPGLSGAAFPLRL